MASLRPWLIMSRHSVIRPGCGTFSLSVFVLAGLLATCGPLCAHPDLQIQIEELDRRIAEDPQNPELLARRGDLHRRHQDYTAAAADLRAAREADPGNARIDLLEAELLLDTGQLEGAAQGVTRYLAANPGHAEARVLRARAWLGLGRPAPAADDISQAITAVEKPAPELFRLLVLSLAAQGEDRWRDALEAVNAGLERYPLEVSLLGLGTDIALCANRRDEAIDYLGRLPQGINQLPQWKRRLNRAACLDQAGQPDTNSCLRGAREDLDRQVESFMAEPAPAPSAPAVPHH